MGKRGLNTLDMSPQLSLKLILTLKEAPINATINTKQAQLGKGQATFEDTKQAQLRKWARSNIR